MTADCLSDKGSAKMNVLILNGSPKGDRSNTIRIAKAFTEGFPEGTNIRRIDIYSKDIKPCRGCFSCWRNGDGRCVIKDDMEEIVSAIKEADVIIESYPLYFYGMPSQMKAVTDRCLQLVMPYMGEKSDSDLTFNEMKDPDMLNKHMVLISTCGYVEAEPVYPALLAQYDLMCGKGGYTAILCPEGEIFVTGQAKRQQEAYLDSVRAAGAEYASAFALSDETMRKIAIPILSPQSFCAITKSHWLDGHWIERNPAD